MASAMKLYSHALAPNPRRVRIFAAEKGIELAVQDIDIRRQRACVRICLPMRASGSRG
jgi:glutathione S-transferase